MAKVSFGFCDVADVMSARRVDAFFDLSGPV